MYNDPGDSQPTCSRCNKYSFWCTCDTCNNCKYFSKGATTSKCKNSDSGNHRLDMYKDDYCAKFTKR